MKNLDAYIILLIYLLFISFSRSQIKKIPDFHFHFYFMFLLSFMFIVL